MLSFCTGRDCSTCASFCMVSSSGSAPVAGKCRDAVLPLALAAASRQARQTRSISALQQVDSCTRNMLCLENSGTGEGDAHHCLRLSFTTVCSRRRPAAAAAHLRFGSVSRPPNRSHCQRCLLSCRHSRSLQKASGASLGRLAHAGDLSGDAGWPVMLLSNRLGNLQCRQVESRHAGIKRPQRCAQRGPVGATAPCKIRGCLQQI